MAKHALLSASASYRWLACPPSARLCAKYEDKGSEYAQQGTDAHTLCEYKLKDALGMKCSNPTENLSYYDAEMEDCAEGYAAYVVEQMLEIEKTCPDVLVLVEQHLNFSKYVPEGFGTGDCVIVSDGVLHIIDYKHGSHLVDANDNPQLMCYALGALEMFDGIYNVDTVKMTIYQPRRSNVGTFSLSRDELLTWAKDVLAPIAALAYKGEGEFKAGGHCQFCKAKASCRKRAEYNLELARYDFEMPAILQKEEIAVILAKVDDFVSWANDVKDYALAEALKGAKFDGFKLVAGRSSRKYMDEKKVAEAVSVAGYEPYEQKLLGITAMTSALGKKKFEELLGDLTYKPQGKPTLVPVSDKRKELNTINDDFKEEINHEK